MRHQRPRAHARPRPTALAVERLEDRTVPAFLDLGGLRFDAGANDFVGGTATGPVNIGFTPTQGEQFKPLLVSGSVTVGTTTFTPTDLAAITTTTAGNVPLVSGSPVIPLAAFAAGGVGPAGDGVTLAGLTVAGLPFGFTELGLYNPGGPTSSTADAVAQLEGSFTLPAPFSSLLPVTVGGTAQFNGQGVSLADLDASIPAGPSVTVGEVEFALGAMTIGYSSAGGDDTFTLSGSASATVGDDTLSVALGGDDTTGLVIKNGGLDSLDLAVTGDLTLFGLDVEVGDENGEDPLTFDYDATADSYAVGGKIQITELFSVTVDLGDKGLTVTDGKFRLNSATLSVGDIDLGAFELNDLSVTVTDDRFTGGSLSVTFPGGWEVDGSVTIDSNGQLEDISVGLTFGEEGIAIGDTGAFVVEVDASLQNLDQPANLVVSGTVAISYGGSLNVTVDGEEQSASLFVATGSFTVDSQMLELDAGGFLGAYKDDGGAWQGAIASGTADLTLDWGAGSYSAAISVTYYSVIEMSGSITFDRSGDVTVVAEADVILPPEIPFIGGTKVGGMDFVFVYHKADKSGFAAAWIELDIFRKFDIGVLYNLDGTYRVIGTKDIPGILDQATQPDTGTWYYASQTFSPPPGVTSATFGVSWVGGGQQTLQLTAPGYGMVDESQFSNDKGMSLVPQLTSNSVRTMRVVGSSSDPLTTLPTGSAGNYVLTLVVRNAPKYAQDPVFTYTYHYLQPTVTVTSVQPPQPGQRAATVTLSGAVAGYLAQQNPPRVSLHLDDDPGGYDGRVVNGDVALLADLENPGSFTATVPVDVSGLNAGDYHFYAGIDDGVNTRAFSTYSPVTIDAGLSGTVTDASGPGRPTVAGVAVTLTGLVRSDNGDGLFVYRETKLTDDPTSPTPGAYSFTALKPGTEYTLTVDVPPGYVADPAANPGFQLTPAGDLTYVFTYQGGAVSGSVNLNRLTVVTGTVYDDLNANGVKDDGEPGLPNLTLALDDGAGNVLKAQTNTAGVYAFSRPPAGTYALYLSAPDNTGGYAQTYPAGQSSDPSKAVGVAYGSVTVQPNSPYQHLTGYDFGALQPVVIAGTAYRRDLVNGVLSPTPGRLPGATVNVYAPGGTTAVATATTDRNGNYSVTVQAGTYTVVQTPPAGYAPISPFAATFGTQTPIRLPAAQRSNWVATGDFDGDRNLDFALADPNPDNGGQVAVFFGDGKGGFDPAGPFTFSAGLTEDYELYAADLDNDGDLDLLAVGEPGPTALLVNAGGQSGGRRGQFTAGAAPGTGSGGIAQVVVGNFGTGGQAGLNVAYTDGGGFGLLYAAAGQSAYYVGLANPGPLAAADLNGDGNPDLVVGGATGPASIGVAYGDGLGGFSAVQDTGDTGMGAVGYLALADVNGDGLLDLAAGELNGSLGTAGVQIALGTGNPAAPFAYGDTYANMPYPGGQTANLYQFVVLRDVDGDLRPDLVTMPQKVVGGTINVVLNDGTGGFPFGGSIQSFQLQDGAEPSAAWGLGLGDFDNDGRVDFVATDANYAGAVLILNATQATAGTYTLTAAAGQTPGRLDFMSGQTGGLYGAVYHDRNRSGSREAGEPGRGGLTVYLDLNGNGARDADEPRTTTSPEGVYAFARLPDGAYPVRVEYPAGQLSTDPAPVTAVVSGGRPGGATDLAVADALLAPVADRTAPRGTEFVATLGLTDAAAGRLLVYRLVDGPAGATTDPYTGDLRWAPTPAQLGRSYRTTVRVSDPLDPRFGETASFALAAGPRQGLAVAATADPAAVAVFDPVGGGRRSIAPFGAGFAGGFRVATADITGDGVDDLIAAAGPSGGPAVKVFDGATGAEVASFFAYDPAFRGGLAVAAGDLDGDGVAEVVVAPLAGGGPHVKAFDARTGRERLSFLAYGSDFRGGVSVAAGDLDGDGRAEIVTGAGPGGGPHVKVFDGPTGTMTRQFMAYDPSFRDGVEVAAGDVDGDGTADVLTAPGVGGAPHVRAVSGAKLMADAGAVVPLADFFAGDPNARRGARVATADLNADGTADLLVRPGDGSSALVYRAEPAGGADRVGFLPLDGYADLAVGGVYVD